LIVFQDENESVFDEKINKGVVVAKFAQTSQQDIIE